MTRQTTQEAIWEALDEVKDPEIPVVSLVEMGIVRDVIIKDDHVTVTMTPTFAGCPALHVMQDDIGKKLTEMGFMSYEVKMVLSPAWSSDWITEEARAKLKEFGLAPPPKHGGKIEVTFYEPVA